MQENQFSKDFGQNERVDMPAKRQKHEVTFLGNFIGNDEKYKTNKTFKKF